MRFSVLPLAVASFVGCAIAARPARADTIDFDDFDTSPGFEKLIADEYRGLSWDRFEVLDVSAYEASRGTTENGYRNGIVSGDHVVFNWGNDEASFTGSGFTLVGAYFTSAWNDGLNIDIRGFASGAELYSVSIEVDTTGPTYVRFDWSGIDTVTFYAYGGTSAGFPIGSGTTFAMDDLEIHPVPEPTTLALLGLGAVGLAWRRRARRARP